MNDIPIEHYRVFCDESCHLENDDEDCMVLGGVFVKEPSYQKITDDIKLFYFRERNNKVRLYLWAHNQDFVVILQKLGKTETFLVTSFYIMYSKKRRDFDKRYQAYCNGKTQN